MASDKAYLDYVLDQLSGLEEITVKPMMGEYLLYYRGRLFGGIYDDRLLLKPTPSACAVLGQAPLVAPYAGAKEMLLADPDDRALLEQALPAMLPELPAPKKRRA